MNFAILTLHICAVSYTEKYLFCRNLTFCISCILFPFIFVHIILISAKVVFENVAFLVIHTCDSACVKTILRIFRDTIPRSPGTEDACDL